MPLYEYVCETCRDEFELLIRGNESPKCPACGGARLLQQLSVVAAHTVGGRELPICSTPSPTGCGLPQCGAGRCAMDE
jgi:putative FmdB family regulatory protein